MTTLPESRAKIVPSDPALREQWDALIAKIKALKKPTDEQIAEVEAQVTALTELLDARAAGGLNSHWGIRCQDHYFKPLTALGAFDRAALSFEQVGDEGGLARIDHNRGHVFASLSRNEDALEAYGRAEAYYKKVGDEGGLAWIAFNRGNAFRSTSRHAEALEAYGQAEAYYEKVGDEGRLVQVVQHRGSVFLLLSRPAEALEAYGRAEAYYKKVGDESGLAGIAHDRGNVFASLSRDEEALEAYGQAEAYYKKVGDEDRLAQVFKNRATVFRSLSRYAEALEAYGRAEAYYKKVGAEGRLAVIAINRGNVFASLSRYAEALEAYGQAEAYFKNVGDEDRLAWIAHNRGSVFSYLSRYAEALEAYGQAEAYFKKVGDEGSLAGIAHNRGMVFQSLSRFPEALEAFSQAEAYYKKVGDEGRLALIALGRGMVFQSLSCFPEALEAFSQAEAYYKKGGDETGLAWIAQDRGSVFQSLSRHAEALQAYEQSIAHREAMLVRQVQRLGETSSEGYRSEFATMPVSSLKCLSAINDRSRDQVASAYRVVQTTFALGVTEGLREGGAFNNLELSAEERGQLAKIDAELRDAISRRDGFTSPARARPQAEVENELSPIVSRIRELTASENVILDAARLRRAMALAIDYPRGAPLAEVEAAIPTGSALIEYVFDEKQGCYAFVIRRSGTQVLDLGDPAVVAADLKAVVAEMKTGTSSGAGTVEPLRRLGTRLLNPVLKTFGKDDRPKTLLVALHGELCRIPFELLLTEDVAATAPAATWPFLLKSFDVAYVHSGTVLHAMRQDAKRPRERKEGSPDLVAFGFPYDAEAEAKDTGRHDLPKDEIALLDKRNRGILFWAADEVLEIARLFASGNEEEASLASTKEAFQKESLTTMVGRITGKRFSIFLRTEANEQRLKTSEAVGQARIVHFACHGEADLTSPQLSRLVLARSKELEEATNEDGYFYVRDLKGLRLAADLLVLSACGTNDGTRSSVEGITGLSRAGLVAGARSVLSTLWPVDDAAARELVVDFYRRWIQGGQTRIRALCDAKRTAIAKGLPITTWSAYTLFDVEVE